MRKLAIIRDDEGVPCPFGLSINSACSTAGEVIDQMHPIDKLENTTIKNQIIEYNQKLLNKASSPSKCKYASHLFPNKSKFIDCNYNDTGAGFSDAPLLGSPYYSKVMDGTGMAGLLSYPETKQVDLPIYRNPYYGNLSWAQRELKSILRQALLKTILNK